MVEGVRDGLRVSPAAEAVMAKGKVVVEVERKRAEGVRRGREPVFGEESASETGSCDAKEVRRGIDEMDFRRLPVCWRWLWL